MTIDNTLLILILALPLAGFLLLGLFGRKYFGNASGVLATAFLACSAAIALMTAYQYFMVMPHEAGYKMYVAFNYTWLKFADNFSIDMGYVLDPISVMMLVVVTFVSLMVHIYSLGYMKGEERFATFYAFLQLFTFSMLGLVISANIFQIYMFWELVGVSSFLLIGYYFDRPSAVAASKKAFIVTRFADLGFLAGILILSYYAKTFDFQMLIIRLTDGSLGFLQTATASTFIGVSALTWGLVLVFIGGAGKSAMFPLHIWLPDAMEGPTPVSALIHAATMVVAGVYLVARLFPVMATSCPVVLDVVTVTGILSAAFAAVIACTQTDIKRVLAYSTMSQIGYMMFALGVARNGGENALGFTASMYHLFTHAMFKALLFLGAGAVIHHVHSNYMTDMGGLRKAMPVTHITFLIACLAIAGIPPFSGFFSKEEILLATYHHNTTVFVLAVLTSGLTAFYMFRLYFSIFWNKQASDHHNAEHHGEAPVSMISVLVILGVAAAVTGFVPFGSYVTATGQALESHIDIVFSITPVMVGVLGILIAMAMYKSKNTRPDAVSDAIRTVYESAYRKFYIDEIYLAITKGFLFGVVGKFAAWFDRAIVDGLMNTLGLTAQTFSDGASGWQSGRVQSYAMWFFIGAFGLALFLIYGL